MHSFFKRAAIAGAALSCVTAAQAADLADAASPSSLMYSGVIEMFGGFSSVKGDAPEYDDEARRNNPMMGGFSAVNIPVSDGMSVQLDLRGATIFAHETEGEDDEADDDMLTGNLLTAMHLSGRNEDMLFGAFGGIGRVSFHDEESATYMLGGAELQAYFGSTTIYLQGGYLTSDQSEENADDTLRNAYFVRAVARLYASDTSRLSTEVAYASGETDAFPGEYVDATVLAWGVRFDQQLSDTPASAFLAYSGANYQGGCSSNADWYDHRVMIGLSFAFGGNTIMANDRQGAALDTPDVGSWVAAGEMNQSTDGCGIIP